MIDDIQIGSDWHFEDRGDDHFWVVLTHLDGNGQTRKLCSSTKPATEWTQMRADEAAERLRLTARDQDKRGLYDFLHSRDDAPPEDGVFVRRVTVEIIKRQPVSSERDFADQVSGGDIYAEVARRLTDGTGRPVDRQEAKSASYRYLYSGRDVDKMSRGGGQYHTGGTAGLGESAVPALMTKDEEIQLTDDELRQKNLKAIIRALSPRIEEKDEESAKFGGSVNFITATSSSDAIPSELDGRRFFVVDSAKEGLNSGLPPLETGETSTFTQEGYSFGRISSIGPNLSQIPKAAVEDSAVMPGASWSVEGSLEVKFSDPQLLEEYRQGHERLNEDVRDLITDAAIKSPRLDFGTSSGRFSGKVANVSATPRSGIYEDGEMGLDLGEVVVEQMRVEREVSSGTLSLREPILINANTAHIDSLFSELLSEIGMSKMQMLAEMTSDEFERRSSWLDSESKIQEAGLERQRLNSVRVLWGPELGLSVLVETDECKSGLEERVRGDLHCPQAKSDDDAFAIGMMFLKGPQDPSEFPLMTPEPVR